MRQLVFRQVAGHGIDGNAVIAIDDDGIDIQLADDAPGQHTVRAGHRHDILGERPLCGVAEAPAAAFLDGFLYHAKRAVLVDGRQCGHGRHALLHVRPPQAEQHDAAVLGVDAGTEKHLHVARDHLFQQHAFYLRFGG